MAQWVELCRQDVHVVGVGMTQYKFSAEEERVLMSVTATRIIVDVDRAITHQHDCRNAEDLNKLTLIFGH